MDAIIHYTGIGIGMVVVSAFVGLYYNILVSYILYFFFASMNSELPWKDCDNHWNTERCITLDQMANKSWLGDYLNCEFPHPPIVLAKLHYHHYQHCSVASNIHYFVLALLIVFSNESNQ
jgi:hypothetical protein